MMKKFSSARECGKIQRVGLISPCSGNLGNAAIMSSMVENLRSRIPGVEIIGITLSQEDTSRRHGIATFPITGATHGTYYCLASPSGPAFDQGASPRVVASLKAALKRIGWIRKAAMNVRIMRSELNHILRAARLVGTLDRIVVTGGGALDDFWGGPWGHPWTLLKFGLLGRLFRVPVLFVSVGMCTLDHPLSRLFVRIALRASQYISYRDAGSEALVNSMFPGVGGSVWPDLAYGYSCQAEEVSHHRSDGDSQLLIAVSPIAFFDPRSWPESDGDRYSRYVGELTLFLKWVASEGHKLILFTTDGCDIDTMNDLVRMLLSEQIDATRIELLAHPPAQTTEALLKSLAPADLVVASRLHGTMLSHLIAKPVVAISFDRKVDAHMKEIGQDHYCLNIDTFTFQTLKERFTDLKKARECESVQLQNAVRQFRVRVESQYDFLFGKQALNAREAVFMDQEAARVRV